MSEFANAMAKLAGVRKAVEHALAEQVGRGNAIQPRPSFAPADVGKFFEQFVQQTAVLSKERPDLYGDFVMMEVGADLEMMPDAAGQARRYYSRTKLMQLIGAIDQLMEIRASSVPPAKSRRLPMRVFLSHGRSKDWMDVQRHIEKEVGLDTLELAQEASQGQTVIEKLETNSELCDSAVIVMSGDDSDAAGQSRVRENVMHEIGFFHAKYGRSRVILLHEEGVSIPTNLAGIVYVSYPKGYVHATYSPLDRELLSIYR
ncbi:TIR domain-containing protein [Burkholderia cepacia]|uniref:TIR domain-containing protein n=1 Tax=Burkholderia cepacia TaxID=292 RepID=UPI00158EBFC7|nr:nucleotide-binding protein [Burkholderia cepacia]MCA8162503.1 nucleotide-binding protein [Burkholderia cepacia]